VVYSHTQLQRYLGCPKAYRYHYLEGWRERDDRASLLFGRCFEQALAALFLGQDPAVELFQRWSAHRDAPLEYSRNDNWDSMLRQGIGLLEAFARENRVMVPEPHQNLQVRLTRQLSSQNEFVGYIDAIGTLDGQRTVLEWKTTTARYPDEPQGILGLDPQLICYSWLTGIPDVSVIAFLRKRTPEIQYLKASISDRQRREFGELVDSTIARIEAGEFPSHSGIRFPRNACVSCAHLGLCLDKPELVAANLIRKPGANDLDWVNDLDG
jgi:hypothetical protein